MMGSMRWLVLVLFCWLMQCTPIEAIYREDVGQLDWSKSMIGPCSQIHYHHSILLAIHPTHRLLSGLEPLSGRILWRLDYEQDFEWHAYNASHFVTVTPTRWQLFTLNTDKYVVLVHEELLPNCDKPVVHIQSPWIRVACGQRLVAWQWTDENVLGSTAVLMLDQLLKVPLKAFLIHDSLLSGVTQTNQIIRLDENTLIAALNENEPILVSQSHWFQLQEESSLIYGAHKKHLIELPFTARMHCVCQDHFVLWEKKRNVIHWYHGDQLVYTKQVNSTCTVTLTTDTSMMTLVILDENQAHFIQYSVIGLEHLHWTVHGWKNARIFQLFESNHESYLLLGNEQGVLISLVHAKGLVWHLDQTLSLVDSKQILLYEREASSPSSRHLLNGLFVGVIPLLDLLVAVRVETGEEVWRCVLPPLKEEKHIHLWKLSSSEIAIVTDSWIEVVLVETGKISRRHVLLGPSLLVPQPDGNQIIGKFNQDLNQFMTMVPFSVSNSLSFYKVNDDSIVGYRVLNETCDKMDQMEVSPCHAVSFDWQFQLPEIGQPFQIATPRYHKVASLGRVLGNRNVSWKYLNPNLLSVVQNQTLFIMDTLTGSLIHSASLPLTNHDGYLMQWHENQLLVSYWSLKEKKTEFLLLALIETKEKGVQVESRAFTVKERVRSLGVTQTLHGITSRHWLVLTGTGQLYTIHKKILDTRRPFGSLSSDDQQEELVLYHPVIDLTFPLTYGLSLQVDHIQSHATPLESHSVVLLSGLDWFCTRMTPIQAFDTLRPEFQKEMLVVTLVVLVVAIVVCWYALKQQKIHLKWR